MKRNFHVGGAVFVVLLSFFYTSKTKAQMSAPQPAKANATVPAMEPPVMDNQIFNHILL